LDRAFKIAQVSAAHGIKGEVKLVCFLEDPKTLERYNPLTDKQGKPFAFTITGHTKDHVLARVEGIADRNTAELLRGTELFADAAKRPPLKQNEFYQHDLIGMSAMLEDGTKVGTITDVANYGAGDIIEITTEHDEFMLPFKAPFVGKIKDRTIIVMLPEYLEDKEESRQ
jgi:16S rRNA processing protein RimM